MDKYVSKDRCTEFFYQGNYIQVGSESEIRHS